MPRRQGDGNSNACSLDCLQMIAAREIRARQKSSVCNKKCPESMHFFCRYVILTPIMAYMGSKSRTIEDIGIRLE